MKKLYPFIVVLPLLLLFVQQSFAQLSTGRNSYSVIKTGNLPEAGDWGVFVGVGYSDFENIFSRDIEFKGFPLVNIKRYISDNLEVRMGLQFQGTATKISGEVIESSTDLEFYDVDSSDAPYQTSTYLERESSGSNRFIPGVAYHFSRRNLIDVYIGASMPIGWDNNVTVFEVDGVATTSYISRPFTLGLSGYIGLQGFVADLPISVGLEYGILGIKQFGDKTKVRTIDEMGYITTHYTPNSSSFAGSNYNYEKLTATNFSLSNEVRITVSYYFKSK